MAIAHRVDLLVKTERNAQQKQHQAHGHNGQEQLAWNMSTINPNCPLQSLPGTIRVGIFHVPMENNTIYFNKKLTKLK